MKKFFVAAGTCLLLVAACKKADRQPAVSVHPVIDHESKFQAARNPYYYGLIEEYRRMLAQDAHNLSAMIGLGNAYLATREWREAVAQYEQALRLDSRNADVHSGMGTAYQNMGRTDRALAEYRMALRYDPEQFNARYNMGMLYAFDAHNYALAIGVWEELLRRAPNYPHAAYMRTCIEAFREKIKKEK